MIQMKNINSILRYLLVLTAVYFIAAYIWVALHRIGYPYELEWMEGAMVDECRQLLSGSPLYCPPGLDYVPFIYPPGYFVLSSFAMRLFGVGFIAPRLISLLASSGILLLLFGIIKRETDSFRAGIVSAGIFAAAYAATGGWMDIARVDSLFLFWVILGIYTALRWENHPGGTIVTALIFSAAFFTKQVALAPSLAVGLYYLIKSRKQFYLYALTIIMVAGGGTLWLNYYYRGWYIYYVFQLSSSHSLQLSQIREFVFRDIFLVFPFVFGISIYAGIVIVKDRRSFISSSGLLYLLLGASLFAVSFVGRANINSYINTLLPLALALALLSGWIWGREEKRSIRSNRSSLITGNARQTVISILIVVQFIMLGYLPSRYIPTRADYRAGDKLVALMESSPGPILLPFHGYLPRLAGKESSAHWTAILDLLLARRAKEDDPGQIWLNQFAAAMEEGRYEMLILDREDWFPDLLKLQYKKGGTIFGKKQVFYPVTGYPWRPQFIYNRIITGGKL